MPLRYAVMLGALVIFARAVPFRSPRLRDPRQLMASSLLALPLIVLLSPSAEDIHYTMLIAPMVGLGWLAWERGLRQLAASWVLWGVYALSSIPRMQELVYPGKLFPLPGQHDPHLMTIVIFVRTGILFWIGLATYLSGALIVRHLSPRMAPTSIPATVMPLSPNAGIAGA
jgi:hypothetical protein